MLNSYYILELCAPAEACNMTSDIAGNIWRINEDGIWLVGRRGRKLTQIHRDRKCISQWSPHLAMDNLERIFAISSDRGNDFSWPIAFGWQQPISRVDAIRVSGKCSGPQIISSRSGLGNLSDTNPNSWNYNSLIVKRENWTFERVIEPTDHEHSNGTWSPAEHFLPSDISRIASKYYLKVPIFWKSILKIEIVDEIRTFVAMLRQISDPRNRRLLTSSSSHCFNNTNQFLMPGMDISLSLRSL